jgi:hypothetical protein
MKLFLVLIVVSGSLLAQSPTKHPSGDIRGTVIDRNGSPVSTVTVYAVPQGLMLDDAIPRSVKTDRDGVFDFRGGLQFGAYKLYSRKDVDGYPDPFDSFYADAEAAPTAVDLMPEHPSSTVNLKLGRQAAVVSGKIIDANSGALLKASLGVVDAQGHGHSVTVNGDYRIIVPSEKDVTLMVTLLEPTGRSLTPVAPLRLEPGQRVYMDIPISSVQK